MLEVLKQALEALEVSTDWDLNATGKQGKSVQAIISLRQAIQKLESQEPVAWLEPEWREKICPEVGYEVTMTDDHPRDLCWIPLYATPPTAQRKPLEVDKDGWFWLNKNECIHVDLIRKIEAAHGIKE